MRREWVAKIRVHLVVGPGSRYDSHSDLRKFISATGIFYQWFCYTVPLYSSDIHWASFLLSLFVECDCVIKRKMKSIKGMSGPAITNCDAWVARLSTSVNSQRVWPFHFYPIAIPSHLFTLFSVISISFMTVMSDQKQKPVMSRTKSSKSVVRFLYWGSDHSVVMKNSAAQKRQRTLFDMFGQKFEGACSQTSILPPSTQPEQSGVNTVIEGDSPEKPVTLVSTDASTCLVSPQNVKLISLS